MHFILWKAEHDFELTHPKKKKNIVARLYGETSLDSCVLVCITKDSSSQDESEKCFS